MLLIAGNIATTLGKTDRKNLLDPSQKPQVQLSSTEQQLPITISYLNDVNSALVQANGPSFLTSRDSQVQLSSTEQQLPISVNFLNDVNSALVQANGPSFLTSRDSQVQLSSTEQQLPITLGFSN